MGIILFMRQRSGRWSLEMTLSVRRMVLTGRVHHLAISGWRGGFARNQIDEASSPDFK